MCKKNCKCSPTIGYDVEFFMKDSEGNIVSAIGKIPGTKYKQHLLSTGAGLHHDNVSLEIAFKPFKSFKAMEDHIEKTLEEVKQMIYPYTLDKSAAYIFPDSELQNDAANEFGCDPDFNAWVEDINPRPECDNKNLRTNGGHVHIGSCKLQDDLGVHCKFIRNMDALLGMWSLEEDTDTLRRKLYGKAGCFRPKSYGLEYRVLSNFWIFSKEHREKVWDMTMKVFNNYQAGKLEEIDEDIEVLINGGE